MVFRLSSRPCRSRTIRVSEVVNPGAPEEGTQFAPESVIGCGWVVAQRPPLIDSTTGAAAHPPPSNKRTKARTNKSKPSRPDLRHTRGTTLSSNPTKRTARNHEDPPLRRLSVQNVVTKPPSWSVRVRSQHVPNRTRARTKVGHHEPRRLRGRQQAPGDPTPPVPRWSRLTPTETTQRTALVPHNEHIRTTQGTPQMLPEVTPRPRRMREGLPPDPASRRPTIQQQNGKPSRRARPIKGAPQPVSISCPPAPQPRGAGEHYNAKPSTNGHKPVTNDGS